MLDFTSDHILLQYRDMHRSSGIPSIRLTCYSSIPIICCCRVGLPGLTLFEDDASCLSLLKGVRLLHLLSENIFPVLRSN